MDRNRNIFLRMIADKTIRQIIASAFISPFGVFIISYSHTFKKLTGFSFAKNPEPFVTTESVSFFLKISNRNGLNNPNEITENKLERTLKLKYAKINLGYFDT
jgi:hypothetical protein